MKDFYFQLIFAFVLIKAITFSRIYSIGDIKGHKLEFVHLCLLNSSLGIGMVIALCTCISGVLVMSLPVPIIVNNFSAFYSDTKRREVTQQRRADKKKLELEEEEQKRQIEKEEKMRFLENSFKE